MKCSNSGYGGTGYGIEGSIDFYNYHTSTNLVVIVTCVVKTQRNVNERPVMNE